MRCIPSQMAKVCISSSHDLGHSQCVSYPTLIQQLLLLFTNRFNVEYGLFHSECLLLLGSMLELFEAKRKRGANGYGAFSLIFSEALSGQPLLGHTPIILFFILYNIHLLHPQERYLGHLARYTSHSSLHLARRSLRSLLARASDFVRCIPSQMAKVLLLRME